MPAISHSGKQPIDPQGTYRVLVTGYGPFAQYEENPSWLAVRKLNNLILDLEPARHAKPLSLRGEEVLSAPGGQKKSRVHITTLKVPVTYEAVLRVVPLMHLRPPRLDSSDDKENNENLRHVPQPPTEGYDFVLHVGVAFPGALRVETKGHKYGYNYPDAAGKLAPLVEMPAGETPENKTKMSEAEKREYDRLVASGRHGGKLSKTQTELTRGFGNGYEVFPAEILTELDSARINKELSRSGKDSVISDNAGRYLCDFIYYCSLAESLRSETAGATPSKVLFLHCPPTDKPYNAEDVAEAVKTVVETVCRTEL